MSYIPNIKTFVRVYDLGSMSAAGRDLRVSAAVASSRIGELEKHLGVRLFNRTTRTLNPTEQGELFYTGAVRILDLIEEVEGSIADVTDSPRGTVFLSAPLGLGKKLIAPLIPAFKQTYPDVNVRLRLSDRRVDVMGEGLDAAFVLGLLKDSEMRVRQVFEFDRVLCASPDYIERYGKPTSLKDLHHHQCLLLRFPGSEEFFWSFDVSGKRERFDLKSPLESDARDVLTGWAIEGCGLVNKTRFEVAEELASGRLVELLPKTPPTPVPFSCVFPHKRLQDMKTRLLIEHLVGGCQKLVR